MSVVPNAQPDDVPRVGRGEETVIAIRNASVWYGPVIGINNISLDIGHGVIGLLGPNGAGKSTLLKAISGQLKLRTGGVRLLGRPVWNDATTFSNIGLVPEQDAFYEDMTGRQFVVYLTRLQGYAPRDAAALTDRAIELVALEDRQNDPIHTYSKGMRQRIKIAQALAHDPRVLFLDEPLAGTDPVGRRHIMDLIRQMGDEGKTVVVSSHILHEVESMTTTIVLINKGRVLADGDVHRIRAMIDEWPHTIFVDCHPARHFAALLIAHDDVLSVEVRHNGLAVTTSDPDSCYDRVVDVALEHHIELRGMSSPDNDLSAVFKYLVG
ncbi:MAG: ABC transporter ATP-binding protein [Myxococcota bacterium]